ncbi:MAG: [FeFe] hydrogenase H-cluster radical SAM maturase HydG [Candidatus Omnitrophica bacterium]|jgi:2-iminoacetate synthase|nr:[FeFe] hydrogenase H-cluster radical SAM maturase HydG [Candidatus Omnitrophota bacterium]MDD5079549.1 [FeFe] hydrogenase H-cluster radical SAM maturase HydG [Candidatus Omnitrophota bacterium]
MHNALKEIKDFKKMTIKEEENAKYLNGGKDFIDDPEISRLLKVRRDIEPGEVRDIIRKSRDIQSLELSEAAALLNVEDKGLWEEIFDAAARIKRKVYDNRVVTFAPLYCSSLCVNNCAYCGFRGENQVIERRTLSISEVRKEAEVLAGKLGHKRLVVVFGEHPSSGADYICEVMREIYDVKIKTRRGFGAIRRVNVNAAPMSIADYKKVKAAGIGTFQVFQETYHRRTYGNVHPANTIKGDFGWRLYSLHRAMEAGIDDVAIGALFGLYAWRFEVLGLLAHARDLEKYFGIGPHTVSFPRLEPAANTPFINKTEHAVKDDDFKKLVAVLRLAIPYAGMIVTCREPPRMMGEVIAMCTQRDASSKVGIGAYSERGDNQEENIQQFILGDSRSLDEVIRDLAARGYITSFCTAGYRCGRTGDNIMSMLKTGREGCLCKLNAVLTFQEWLDDFGSDQTRKIGEGLIDREIAQIKARVPADFSAEMFRAFSEYHSRIRAGERDLCF